MKNLIGYLIGYSDPVYYNLDGITNILSLSNVKQHHRVTYDKERNETFTIHKYHGSILFRECTKGLYYHNTALHGNTVLTIVEEKKELYTKRQFIGAKTAQKLQGTIGYPSTKSYLKIIDGNLLKNYPITSQDIIAAEDIFGPNMESLKGKTTWKAPNPVRGSFLAVPPTILICHQQVMLSTDIMFVNRILFIITQSRVM